MDDQQTRVLKEMSFRTGGKFGSPFPPCLFQPGSGFTEKEYDDFLLLLTSQGYLQKYGETGPDIMLTQRALDWIEGESNGENQRKTVEFLKALYAEARGAQIPFDDYILKLGEQLGMKTNETMQFISALRDKGYIRLTGSGTTASISVSQIGKKLFEEDQSVKQQSAETAKRVPYNVFISHIHENEAVAKRLKDYLISIFPEEISVFVSGDPENIPPGQDWFATIIDGIRKCHCMIILCSPDSVERKWIHFEAGAAVALDRKIIPLCFAGLSAGALPSPLNYIRRQAIDSDDGERLKQHFEIFFREITEYSQVDRPIPDVLQSEFYRELRAARPIYRGPPPTLPGRVL